MKTLNQNKQISSSTPLPAAKQYSYSEIVEYLDSHWTARNDESTLKQLDTLAGSPSQKINSILIAGSNGKSLTTFFTSELLSKEGLLVGAIYAPHILTYNERFSLNNQSIANKNFVDVANEVIQLATAHDIDAHSSILLTIMGLLYFKQNNADVVLVEMSNNNRAVLSSIFEPKIAAITRITDEKTDAEVKINQELINDVLTVVKKGSHVVSADQSKLNLQYMQEAIEKNGASWAMPIRKLAYLPYPFEQLHGRCAALAERVAQIYINTFAHKDAIIVSNSLLTKQKGKRGRPTLDAKRQLELNPKKTIDQFWKEIQSSLPARFQLLEKEKPTILLDNAANLDAFENLLLGIRLLHYQRPLKGLTIILGCNNPELNMAEFLKLLRYFFKKTSGQLIVCPLKEAKGYTEHKENWDIEKITNDIKGMKIKARSAKNFEEAYEIAEKSVDERHGLVVITGSPEIVSEYWEYKGIKKF